MEYSFDLHAGYGLPVGGYRIRVMADIFNLFNTQRPGDYDNYTEVSFLSPNPDFGQPSRGSISTYQTPRQVRVGVKFEF